MIRWVSIASWRLMYQQGMTACDADASNRAIVLCYCSISCRCWALVAVVVILPLDISADFQIIFLIDHGLANNILKSLAVSFLLFFICIVAKRSARNKLLIGFI